MATKTIKELATTHFKKQKDTQVNKKRIMDILLQVSHTVDFDDIRFGNGYFIFSFAENSIAWFFMKEFPDWKFAIWLNKEDDGYSIFGEAITLINKFKPSYSTLSFKNVVDFNLELPNILNNTGDWEEYNKEVALGLKQDKLSEEFNKRVFEKVNEYIEFVKKEFNNEKVDTYIKLVDRNTENFKVWPRYQLNEYTDIKGYFDKPESFVRTKKLFTDLCNLLEYNSQNDGDYNREFYLDIDDFLFENLHIQNPRDYEDKAREYKWKTDTTFSEYVEKLV